MTTFIHKINTPVPNRYEVVGHPVTIGIDGGGQVAVYYLTGEPGDDPTPFYVAFTGESIAPHQTVVSTVRSPNGLVYHLVVS